MKIKGVNLGGWLMMEGYILHGRNIPEHEFKNNFVRINGKNSLEEFESLFRNNFITETDIKNIALMGANAIRLPFNCRLVEKKPFFYDESGLEYIRRALDWAQKYRLKVILDLHAAPGAQNCDWHSDSAGKALFWEKQEYRERAYCLWEKIVDRFRDHPALLGYDLLNEAVMGNRSINLLQSFYRNLIRRIRRIDSKHLIFLEGNTWAQQIDFLEGLIDDKVWISIHAYQPISYVFNFIPFYHYPGKIEDVQWNRDKMMKYLEPYHKFSVKKKVNIYVGEFGINWRGGFFGEVEWLKSILGAFDEFNFGYTYWTYKAISNSIFPDGLYQYLPNSKYVRREGPVFGFENYPSLWKKEKKHIVDFWKTKNFTPNKQLIQTLKKHFTK